MTYQTIQYMQQLRRIPTAWRGVLLAACLCGPAAAFAQAGPRYIDPMIPAPPPGARNASAFVSIRNDSNTSMRIVGATSAAARTVEVHAHVNEGGVWVMKPLPGLDVPPRSTVVLQSGGLHIMLIDLTAAPRVGDSVEIRLVYADGRTDRVLFAVRGPGATHAGHGGREGHADPGTGHEAHTGTGSGQGLKHGGHVGHAGHYSADMLPPAGVMGAHMHEPGRWVLDYRYMYMNMNGLMDGSREVAPETVLFGIYRRPRVIMPMTGLAAPSPFLPAAHLEQGEFRYMSVGTEMTMEMHMLSAMYQYSEDTMLMFMLPYVVNRMGMLANNFQTANMLGRGVGDASFSATYRVKHGRAHSLFLGAGLALPTGSTEETETMPQMGDSLMGYSMQPGVGTFSVLTQAGYTGRLRWTSWGAQLDGMLRMGKNENNYRAGNRYSGSIWFAFALLKKWLSLSVRVQKQKWDNYSGQDPGLDPTMDPSNDPKLQGGRRIDSFLGFNVMGPEFLGHALILFELGAPLRQHLHGPQMAVERVANLGLQLTM